MTEKMELCKSIDLKNNPFENDECIFCIHEHENFGDNEHCKKCLKKGDIK